MTFTEGDVEVADDDGITIRYYKHVHIFVKFEILDVTLTNM